MSSLLVSNPLSSLSSGLSLTLVLLTRIFSGCKPPFRAEDRILTRIIHGLIQSGILNVFFSIACLIFYLAASDVTEVTMLVVPLGRLYSNVRPTDTQPSCVRIRC